MKTVFHLFVIIGFILIGTAAADAQGNADKEYTMPEKMYMDCMALDDPLLPDEKEPEYCACISAHAQLYEENLEKEREQAAKENKRLKKKTAHHIRVDQLSQIYGPCTYMHFGEAMYNKCYGDKYVHGDVSSLDELKMLCTCMSMAFEEVLKEKGPEMIKYMSFRMPDVDDPISIIRNHPYYNRMSGQIRNSCRAEFRNK